MPPLLSRPSSPEPLSIATAAAAVMPTTKAGSIRKRTTNNYADTAKTATAKPRGGAAVLSKERKDQLFRLGEALAGPSRAIAPIAIIGGTFSVYSSAIKLSNSNGNPNATDFTPLSILYLFLLALNYAVMPRLSKRYIHPQTNKRSVALAEEVVKMSLGVGGWVISSYVTASNASGNESHGVESFTPITTASVLSQQLNNWSATSTLLAAGLPSALYALQGTLTYTAYQNLDAVTFNGLTQLKVLSSAFCCYMVLGKRQSMMQMVGLGLLMASTVIFQGSWKQWFGGKDGKASSKTNDNNNRRVLLGVLPCLAATLLSGLAGAFSQRSLQTQVGTMHRDPYFYTVELSFLSAVCLVTSMGMEWWRGCTSRSSAESKDVSGVKGDDGSPASTTHFFQHWTYATLLPIMTKATAGLLTALVHRHLGSVIKGFALVLGLVFSALLQFVLEGVDLRLEQVIGTAFVLVSSWLHFTNPVRS